MDIKKNNIKLALLITIIVTVILSTTYAFFKFEFSSAEKDLAAGCFVVDYTGQVISTSDLTSTTEENYTSGAHATVTLNKNANCKIYSKATISLYTDSNTTAPLNELPALKYKVLSGNTIISSGVINNPDDPNSIPTDFSIDLITVDLTTTATTYDIYLWIDQNVSSGLYHEKVFSGYIYATSEQSADIGNN